MSFTYTRNVGAGNVDYAVETSTHLEGPLFEVELPPILLANNGVLRVLRDLGTNMEPRRFMRLRTSPTY